LDTENKGYVTADDFAAYFAEDESLAGINFRNLIIKWNGSKRDERLLF